jgi:hypothetical protein
VTKRSLAPLAAGQPKDLLRHVIIAQRIKEGVRPSRIAEEVGVSRQNLCQYVKRWKGHPVYGID